MKRKFLFWFASILIALWEAVMPIISMVFYPDTVTMGTEALGYPNYFAYTLIICKILGVLAILLPNIPRTLREWAYAGLSFNLIFACISHIYVDKNLGYIILPLVVLGILAISYFNQPYKHKYHQTSLEV